MRSALRAIEPAVSADERAIARTVIYASLFDYPVTLRQLRAALIESAQTEAEVLALYERSAWIRSIVAYERGFFFPVGRRELIAVRSARETFSLHFLERHRTVLKLVGLLPFVRMVAISGSLAHFNLDGSGDLDLFVITRGRRVWTVTLAIVLLAKLLRCRKTVCANYVVADTRLEVAQRDLFTANQIVHLKPIVGEDLLEAFVAANAFVTEYYPNYTAPPPLTPYGPGRLQPLKRIAEWLLAGPSLLVEPLSRRAYSWHLRRCSGSWQSPHQVSLEVDCVKLHTRSHRAPVLARFDAAVAEALGWDAAR